jgi:hypothetical protein
MVDGHYPYIIRHISFFYYLKQKTKQNKIKQKINKKKIILVEGKIIFNYYFFLSNLNLIFKFFISRMKFIYFIIIYLNFYMIWI